MKWNEMEWNWIMESWNEMEYFCKILIYTHTILSRWKVLSAKSRIYALQRSSISFSRLFRFLWWFLITWKIHIITVSGMWVATSQIHPRFSSLKSSSSSSGHGSWTSSVHVDTPISPGLYCFSLLFCYSPYYCSEQPKCVIQISRMWRVHQSWLEPIMTRLVDYLSAFRTAVLHTSRSRHK